MAALAEVKEEWRHFRSDEPGERFRRHRERMQLKSRTHGIVALALGVLLIAVGVVLLFLPGPGTPLIVFGTGLFASHSLRLSNALDRAEPKVRARSHRAIGWWRARSRAERGLLIAGAILSSTAFMLSIWKWVVAAYIV
jgi:uncharacterized membrane protein YbaN (DUF454 family)